MNVMKPIIHSPDLGRDGEMAVVCYVKRGSSP